MRPVGADGGRVAWQHRARLPADRHPQHGPSGHSGAGFREALRLLKERDHARERLRADVQDGFDALARGEGRTYDKVSGRQLAERIKSRGRAIRTKKS